MINIFFTNSQMVFLLPQSKTQVGSYMKLSTVGSISNTSRTQTGILISDYKFGPGILSTPPHITVHATNSPVTHAQGQGTDFQYRNHEDNVLSRLTKSWF